MPLGFAMIAFKSSVLSLMYNMPVVLYLERGKIHMKMIVIVA